MTTSKIFVEACVDSLGMFFICFLIGACVGSFLNVVRWRLPRKESIVSPGSHCPKCQHDLPWFENVPILSYVLLAGRCAACKQPIPVMYVLLEMCTGILFVIGLGILIWVKPAWFQIVL